ncbi:pilus assembly protein TadG-related protein [Microbacterium ulmi]|uniref:Putative Flp pilus-assembly TadG-like N-terminal domain-containing protein n=1 Tax=Microbacterium ulmi TaxID=179095 RepID=A0A7Y2PYV3_9MICO|nr:pilus assembly protein TadG-related protein [Microbacterium ulmi]NII71344.1 putative membrane protein [Microbacterium ulmi]NNH02648.1 hypothetical protein [Microbacterium ulmi]
MRRLRARLAAASRGDEGSILPLTFGYAALCLVAVLVCVDATSLYLAQKRLDALADAAALAGADGFALTVVDGEPRAQLREQDVRAQAEALVVAVGGDAVLVSAGTPDGVSARATVAGTWHPPVFAPFVPAEVALESTATSRTALR